MPAPYRLALRRRIVRAYTHKEGSVDALAERFAVAPATVRRYLKLLKETGSLAPRPNRGRRPRLQSRHLQQIQRLLHEMPDATVAELVEAFAQRYRVEVSGTTMWRALQRIRGDARGSRSHSGA